MLRQLWDDECGAIVSAEVVVIATVLVIALIAGWVVVRNAIFVQLGNQAEWIAGEEPAEVEQQVVQQLITAEDVFGPAGK